MKKCINLISMTLIISVILSLFCVMSPIGVSAEEASALPEFFYPMDEEQDVWVGENATLDRVKYDDYYEATSCQLYVAAWAHRYGGVALISRGMEVPVSPEKNRYLVLNVMPDYMATENQFDKFQVLYWKKDVAAHSYAKDTLDDFTGLYNAEDEVYKKIIVDLGWEEEFTLDVLRLEIFGSSIESTATGQEGYGCGFLYIEYIALFDTLEQAEAFTYKPVVVKPTVAPTATSEPVIPTATPEATEAPAEPTQEPTAVPSDDDKDNKKDEDGKKSPVVGIVIGVVVVAAAVAIIFILKPKKK